MPKMAELLQMNRAELQEKVFSTKNPADIKAFLILSLRESAVKNHTPHKTIDDCLNELEKYMRIEVLG